MHSEISPAHSLADLLFLVPESQCAYCELVCASEYEMHFNVCVCERALVRSFPLIAPRISFSVGNAFLQIQMALNMNIECD